MYNNGAMQNRESAQTLSNSYTLATSLLVLACLFMPLGLIATFRYTDDSDRKNDSIGLFVGVIGQVVLAAGLFLTNMFAQDDGSAQSRSFTQLTKAVNTCSDKYVHIDSSLSENVEAAQYYLKRIPNVIYGLSVIVAA